MNFTLPPLKKLIVEKDYSLKQALSIIEKGGQKVAFVVENQKFLNIITDGDIRRALLKKYNLDTKISKIILNKKCKYLNKDSSFEAIQRELGSDISHLPLVDNKNKLVDYAVNFKSAKYLYLNHNF